MSELTECEDCGWKGEASECGRARVGIQGTEDTDTVEVCPKCGSRWLKHIDGELVLVGG